MQNARWEIFTRDTPSGIQNGKHTPKKTTKYTTTGDPLVLPGAVLVMSLLGLPARWISAPSASQSILTARGVILPRSRGAAPVHNLVSRRRQK